MKLVSLEYVLSYVTEFMTGRLRGASSVMESVSSVPRRSLRSLFVIIIDTSSAGEALGTSFTLAMDTGNLDLCNDLCCLQLAQLDESYIACRLYNTQASELRLQLKGPVEKRDKCHYSSFEEITAKVEQVLPLMLRLYFFRYITYTSGKMCAKILVWHHFVVA